MTGLNTVLVARPTLPPFKQYVKGLNSVWKSRMLSNFSNYAQECERIAKDYLGVKYIRVISNADVGLVLALSVLDLPNNDNTEVVLSSFTFNSTVNAVVWNRYKPVFADIDLDSWGVDPKEVEKKITKRTRVIVATNVFGNPCQIDALVGIAKRYGLYLIFDSACAYGATYKGQRVGNFGDLEVFSLSGTKVVCAGEGGLIATKKRSFFNKLGLSRNYGFNKDYNSRRIGMNGKISETNALMASLTLPSIDEIIWKRNTIANKYIKELGGLGDIGFQHISPGNISTYQSFTIVTKERDKLADFLKKRNIQTKTYYKPIHKMDCFRSGIRLPNTENIARKCLCLPIYNDMTQREQGYVIDSVKKYYNKLTK